jgi:hypothetical protein
MSLEEHRIDIAAPAEHALEAVADVAESWGADWQADSGTLHLPVVAGLRRGLLVGRLEVRPTGAEGCQLTLRAESSLWRVHRSAAAVLVMGLVGALPVLLWPLSGDFLALAPVGLVLMFLAWFMVVSRLRTAGAAEFLEAVRDRLEHQGKH